MLQTQNFATFNIFFLNAFGKFYASTIYHTQEVYNLWNQHLKFPLMSITKLGKTESLITFDRENISIWTFDISNSINMLSSFWHIWDDKTPQHLAFMKNGGQQRESLFFLLSESEHRIEKFRFYQQLWLCSLKMVYRFSTCTQKCWR